MKRSSLKPRTAIRRKQDAEMRKILSEIFAENPRCAFCQKANATTGHHRAGRGRLLLFKPLICGLCVPCHQYVDRNRATIEPFGWFIRLRTQKQIDEVLAMTPEQVVEKYPVL